MKGVLAMGTLLYGLRAHLREERVTSLAASAPPEMCAGIRAELGEAPIDQAQLAVCRSDARNAL